MKLLMMGALFLLMFAGFPSHMRKELFRLAGAKCEQCTRTWGQGWMLEMHHKKPLSLGGENTLNNGICLCRQCHLKAHEKLFKEAKRKGDGRATNVNAHAIRLLKDTIKRKGLKRYGFE